MDFCFHHFFASGVSKIFLSVIDAKNFHLFDNSPLKVRGAACLHIKSDEIFKTLEITFYLVNLGGGARFLWVEFFSAYKNRAPNLNCSMFRRFPFPCSLTQPSVPFRSSPFPWSPTQPPPPSDVPRFHVPLLSPPPPFRRSPFPCFPTQPPSHL